MELTHHKHFPEQYADQLLELMTLCDKDFWPPLSSRESTTQSQLTGEGSGGKPIAYWKEVLKQRCAVAAEDGKLAAFLSYRENHTCDKIGEDTLPNLYLSTLIVNPAFRRRGLANLLYRAVMERYTDRDVYMRTWSTNTAQAMLLPGLGFEELARIKDDRGEGIDTVYYICRR